MKHFNSVKWEMEFSARIYQEHGGTPLQKPTRRDRSGNESNKAERTARGHVILGALNWLVKDEWSWTEEGGAIVGRECGVNDRERNCEFVLIGRPASGPRDADGAIRCGGVVREAWCCCQSKPHQRKGLKDSDITPLASHRNLFRIH